MSKREFKVKFKKEYYNIVRSIVDRYTETRLFGKCDIRCGYDCEKEYMTIWFRCAQTKIEWKLCKDAMHDLEKFKIVEILEESE